MMASVSLLVVNYRSAALAIDAIGSARAASSAPLQVVVVDNSLDPAEAEALRGHADVLIVSTTNRGYAGGINDGRRACTGEVIVVANPDVRFAAGAIDRLVEVLDAKTAVSGPALYWDDGHRWMLPPSSLMTGWEKVGEVLASRSPELARGRARRGFRKRVRFWELERTTRIDALSGAVMAIRAGDFDEAGGFDERFALYFEETDFLRRIAAHRKGIVYVPAAKCRHLYNQSAGQVASEAAERYARSELKYLEKWNGPFLARLLKRLERPPLVLHQPQPLSGPIELDRTDVVIEASPLPSFATAAGYFPKEKTVELPQEVWSSFRGDALYLRVVERGSRNVLATYVRRGS